MKTQKELDEIIERLLEVLDENDIIELNAKNRENGSTN